MSAVLMPLQLIAIPPRPTGPIFDDRTMMLIMRTVARRTRGMTRTGREDVFGAVCLRAWEERATFQPSASDEGTIESLLCRWIDSILRRALRAFTKQGMLDGSAAALERLCADEDGPEVLAHREGVLEGLTDRERSIYRGLREDRSVKLLAKKLGVKKSDVKAVKARLREELSMPERESTPATKPAPVSDDGVHAVSGIDHALNKLSFPPPVGKECPPCLLCSWWERRYEPDKRKRVQAEIVDAEIRLAQQNVYLRKTAISAQVRTE